MENDLVSQLDARSSAIADILRVSGSPGLSIGVFHHGRTIYSKHFGRKDVTRPEPPDDDTVYYLASASKILGICAVGNLVTEGILSWDTPIREYLPEFRNRKDEIGLDATLRDLAANRTGLPLANFFYAQQCGDQLLPKSELARLAADLDPVKPFRTFIYSVWNYFLIHIIAEKATGKPFGDIAREKIFDPLGLEYTTFEASQATNIMKPHAACNDGTARRMPEHSPLDSNTGLAACMGGKSSMKEVLTALSALMTAYVHQRDNGVDETPGSPFTQLRTIFSPHVPLDPSKKASEQGYCLGLYRTQLPGNLSCASLNYPLLQKKVPIFGKSSGAGGKEIFHHTGNLPGFFASTFLVPETQSGVVCLTNSTPLADPTDLSAQLLLEVLLDEKTSTDYLRLAKGAAKAQLGWYAFMSAYLAQNKTDTPPSLPTLAYAGTYINRAGNFRLIVTETSTSLHLSPQGSTATDYDLLPWDGDTFFWEANRDKETTRGMFPFPFPPMHLIRFKVRGDRVASLTWHHDMLSKPWVFRREVQGGGKALGRL